MKSTKLLLTLKLHYHSIYSTRTYHIQAFPHQTSSPSIILYVKMQLSKENNKSISNQKANQSNSSHVHGWGWLMSCFLQFQNCDECLDLMNGMATNMKEDSSFHSSGDHSPY
ncbi:hypothetical protein PanWU01x14_161320 [Parasponia andersonii]|uniref:Uncharacterized protein n=1 Tax=Parasponia andersonii TaxID=3476 RepID=A0A2P5CDX5_PARAD|nr:hypothetical protein PanWU01x14_161320 [Parasponia andersonii]